MENTWIKRNKWIFFVAPLAIALFIWIGGEVVMHLWNWLLPMLFGWKQITLWQALGLLLLSRILFGNFGHGHGHGSDHSKCRGKRDEHWERMTPEEREKFRQDMRSRWCGPGAPTGETGEPA